MKSPAFWDAASSSALKVNLRFGGKYRLHLQGRKLSPERKWQAEPLGSGYSSTLKMEAICYSGTSVDFQRTTSRRIPEENSLRD
jgi:hypothetical protein